MRKKTRDEPTAVSTSLNYFARTLPFQFPMYALRSVHWLEDYLRAFRGTVISITHDRYVGYPSPSANCRKLCRFMQQSSEQGRRAAERPPSTTPKRVPTT